MTLYKKKKKLSFTEDTLRILVHTSEKDKNGWSSFVKRFLISSTEYHYNIYVWQ